MKIKKLINYRKKLSVVGISFHSSNKEDFEKSTGKKGSFNKVVNAIKLLKQNNFMVRVACPIINQDIVELEKICEFLKNLKVDTVQFGINMVPEFILSDQFSAKRIELGNFIKKMNNKYPELNLSVFELGEDSESNIKITGCGAFSKNFVLTPSGKIKPCPFFPEESIFTLEKLEEKVLSSRKMHVIQKFITGNYLVGNKKINEICEECGSYSICSHCFYVRSLLNRDKRRCLLVSKYNFQFEEELKDII